jgi:hypothetical protein
MNSPIDTTPMRACVRLKVLLRDQAQTLPLPARRLLGELVAARDAAGADRRALVEGAALVLSELVDQGQLSDEGADALWLALAGCAHSQHWVSRAAAEACIA